VPARNSGSSTAIVPKVLCQRSFFTRPPRLRRRLLPGSRDAPLGPAVQDLASEPPQLVDHPPLGLIGTRQVAVAVGDDVGQRLDAALERRMTVEHLKQLDIVASGCVHSASSHVATEGCSTILMQRISFCHSRGRTDQQFQI